MGGIPVIVAVIWNRLPDSDLQEAKRVNTREKQRIKYLRMTIIYRQANLPLILSQLLAAILK